MKTNKQPKDKIYVDSAENIQFQAVVESLGEGITFSDGEGKFLVYNLKMQEITGFTQEEANNSGDFTRLLYPDSLERQKALQRLKEITEHKAALPLEVETAIQAKDGTKKVLWVSTRAMKFKDRDMFLSIYRDITQRKLQEEELKKSKEKLEIQAWGLQRANMGIKVLYKELEQRTEKIKDAEESYRAIFELANDAIIIRDINTYQIVDANSKACEMFCYSKEEMVGLNLQSMSTDSPRSAFEILKQFYDKAAIGEPQIFEWLVKDKFGREFWVETSIKKAIIGGKYCFLAIVRNITERKQLLEQRDDFINMVSHELRTPLGAIKESVALIWEGKVGPVDEKQKKIIDVAKRNVDRLARLIDQVLDLQKIDAGKMEFRPDENDMNETIREVHRTMAYLVVKKNLSFILKLDEGLPRVKFDKDKIIQVLTNLVNNAIKFTEKGDITITSSQGNNFVRVSVKDTGPGIKAEDLPRLFRRFSQLGRKPGGTGLGLAISKEIIEMHRGKIGAESELDKGTTFHFILPVKERRM